MAQEPTTSEQELPAYPIRAYQLIPDPNQPAVVALAIETDQGHSLFLATREIGRSRERPAGAGGKNAGQGATAIVPVRQAKRRLGPVPGSIALNAA